MRGTSRGALRVRWAALLLCVLCVLLRSDLRVEAQKAEAAARDVDVVGGDQVAALSTAHGDDNHATHATTQKKTVTITRARVAATIETSRIAGRGVSGSLEECSSSSSAQCAQEPARALPEEDPQEDHNGDYEDQAMDQQVAVLDVAARHLQQLQDAVNDWLPKLEAAVTSVLDEIARMWNIVADTWRSFQHECAVFYEHFLADAVDALTVVYHKIAVVAYDVYSVIRGWVDVVVAQARELWETHEEVRVVTRHAVSLVLLALLGTVFFSVYALVATVPDTVSAMWTSLDDLTRAQLKIVLVLVTCFTVYHLRALWSFWLLLGSVITFYYWSGHVLAKTMKPSGSLSRQASRDAVTAKLKTQ